MATDILEIESSAETFALFYFLKRMIQLTQKYNVNNIRNKLVAELPCYQVAKHIKRKSLRFALKIEKEICVFSVSY